eukprot:jgi/Botrbrau1/13218/Bobra.9_1s0009.1
MFGILDQPLLLESAVCCSWKRCSVDGFSHRLRTDAAVVPSLQVTPQAEMLEGRGPITCKRLWAVAYPVSKQTGRKFVPLQLQSLTTVCSFRHMQLHEQDWHPYVPSIFPNQFPLHVDLSMSIYTRISS